MDECGCGCAHELQVVDEQRALAEERVRELEAHVCELEDRLRIKDELIELTRGAHERLHKELKMVLDRIK